MADKLLIVILNADSNDALQVVEPLYQATVAASMDYTVEVIFSGRAGQLAMRGVANKILTERKIQETVYDLIKDAYKSGVIFKASKFVVQKWGDNLIAEISEVVSTGYIVGEIMNPAIKSLSY
ncbi:MAG: peroxiredoxin [Cardiobacteriaceae bacterium]|nr:peroxiredoxin [Cardiobacteriaceae bacterium]